MTSRDPNCIFCKILDGEIPSYKLAENGNAFAFLDVNPLTEGHALVVPKAHHASLETLPTELVSDVFELVQVVNGLVLDKLSAVATTIGINNGKAAGQAVPHLHVHVVPRYPGDGGGHLHGIVNQPSKREVAAIHGILTASG